MFKHMGGVEQKLRNVLIEDKASGISATQTLRATADPWLADIITPFQPIGDKSQRAEQAAVWCQNGSVLLPEPGPDVPWLLDFEDELFLAPQSEFMDQVDAFSQLVLFVERLLEAGFHARGGLRLAA
jgi:phage terminase large subunit-like protein